jgi:hypothetical protein
MVSVFIWGAVGVIRSIRIFRIIAADVPSFLYHAGFHSYSLLCAGLWERCGGGEDIHLGVRAEGIIACFGGCLGKRTIHQRRRIRAAPLHAGKTLFLNITAFLGSLSSCYKLGLLPFEFPYYLCISLAALCEGCVVGWVLHVRVSL